MPRVHTIPLLIPIVLALLLGLAPSRPAVAASAVQIDAEVDATLARFHEEVDTATALTKRAKGVLVFPSVIKAGFGIGGEYGEGALRVGGRTIGYYNTAAASIGLQLGAQARSEIILFMTDEALTRFQESDGWEVGVDGSVAVVELGAGGEIDTTNIAEPVIGFIFGEVGLMANLSLEGAKITKIDKS
jgi:lipid-binding SYLF domain-containing protein